MIKDICELFAQEAPEIIKKLPAGFSENYNSPTYLDFLRRLAYEANDILDRGDSLIKYEDILFSKDDWITLASAWKNIEDLSSEKIFDVGEHIAKLAGALLRVHGFYALRVKTSINQIQKLEAELCHFRDVVKPDTLSKGDRGYATLYGSLNETKPDHLKGKKIDMREYAAWKSEQDEIASYYNGASTMNPAMLGTGGKTPKEIDIEDGLWACSLDAQRHQETAHGILVLINKMRKIGLSAPDLDNHGNIRQLDL